MTPPALARAYQAFIDGDLVTAERELGQLLHVAPNDINALNLLAGVKRKAGDKAGALAVFDTIARLAPNAAPPHFNRGNLLLEMGRGGEAVQAYDAALAARPGHADTHLNRARAFAASNNHEAAIVDFARAAALGLNTPALHIGRALSLAALGRRQEALAGFDAALQLAPGDADALYNRGRALQSLDRLDEALAAYDEAARLQPENADCAANRAIILHWLGRSKDAEATFDSALALRADHAVTLFTKGVALLAAGDFARGWPLHEIRRRPGVLANMRDHARGEPEWRGGALDGVLRIWPEQGIGDEVLFARLAPLARTRTARVILECADRLAPLFARSFPSLDVRPVAENAAPAAAQIAIGSLGAALKVGVADLQGGAAYLIADTTRVQTLRARYAALARGRPIIGIAWISKNVELGRHKSAALDDWGALLRRDALFLNLQYGDVAEEIAAARARFGCEIIDDSDIDQLADLDAFAAQAAAADGIVSVSNTTVHMAGALGARCLVLAPPAMGLLWYWGVSGDRTPWYQSVRVVRRAHTQSWAQQIEAAAALI